MTWYELYRQRNRYYLYDLPRHTLRGAYLIIEDATTSQRIAALHKPTQLGAAHWRWRSVAAHSWRSQAGARQLNGAELLAASRKASVKWRRSIPAAVDAYRVP